jgi:hypothetical protein
MAFHNQGATPRTRPGKEFKSQRLRTPIRSSPNSESYQTKGLVSQGAPRLPNFSLIIHGLFPGYVSADEVRGGGGLEGTLCRDPLFRI